MDTKSYITDLDTYLVALEVKDLLRQEETPYSIRASVVGSALQSFAGDTDLMRIIVEVVDEGWSNDYWEYQEMLAKVNNWNGDGFDPLEFTREAGSRLAEDYASHPAAVQYKRGILTPDELLLKVLACPEAIGYLEVGIERSEVTDYWSDVHYNNKNNNTEG